MTATITAAAEVVKITEPQKAWMAGILDFRGRFANKKAHNRAYRQIVWTVQSQETGVIRRMCQLIGSKPEVIASRPLSEMFRRSCVQHCPEAHVHVDRDGINMPGTLRFSVTGTAFVTVHYNLVPYLQVERPYEELVAEVNATATLAGAGANQVLNRLAELRNLGWAIPPLYRGALMDRLERVPIRAIEASVDS